MLSAYQACRFLVAAVRLRLYYTAGMDFLDPKKERWTNVKLWIGYGLVAIAIGIATLVLLYQSYGYNLDQGQVTQNGLLFVSSQPTGSAIYLNGKPYKSNTNSRVVVPAAAYTLRISQTGYRPWQRPVVVNGGDVQHFDYPFLFPQKLATTNTGTLASTPSAATQSPDKRWLLMDDTAKAGSFVEYDFKSPDKPVATAVNLPEGSFTPSNGTETWTPIEWAADNKHVLLQHDYSSGGSQTEYVLLDRDSPVDSLDLTTSLHLTQGQSVTLYNNRVDQFYIYDQSAQTLKRVNSSDGSLVSQLDNILSFKTYGSDYILYITDKSPTGKQISGQVSAVLQAGQKTVTLRTLPAGASSYPLNLAQYSGDWYVAVAAANDTNAYLYKNPQDQTVTSVDAYPTPWRRVPIDNPNFLSFSSNTQFLLMESGQHFVIYDFENVAQYRYNASLPIDQPQAHAAWMDGDRLAYVSDGKLVVFDYDNRNRQTLQTMDPGFVPFFAGDFSYVYSLKRPAGDGKVVLNSTALTVKK
jgi:hypothetical protein